MSADSPATVAIVGPRRLDLRSVRVLRYAVGSTIAMAIALGIEWQLSFLAPVLALSLLSSPGPRLTLKQGVGFLASIAVACLAGLIVGRHLISYPLVYVPFAGLLLLRVFYMMVSGRSPLLTTWLLIAILLIPLIAMTSPAIANLVAGGILLSATVTVCVVWLTHGLLPDPPRADITAAAPPKPMASNEDRFRAAWVSTLVVLPLMTLFYSMQLQSALLVLIFVALLSAQPGFASNFKQGFALIIGNTIGGLAAIVMYELLVMMPQFGFLVLLTLLAGLIFGSLLFSEKPTAKLYGMAFSTLLLVIGSTTASTSEGAGAKVYTRVVQIFIAVVYVVMAFGVAERYVKWRMPR